MYDCGGLCNVLYLPLHRSVFAIREIKTSFVLFKMSGILLVILMQHLIRSADSWSWKGFFQFDGNSNNRLKNRHIKSFRHLIQVTIQNCQKILVSMNIQSSHHTEM